MGSEASLRSRRLANWQSPYLNRELSWVAFSRRRLYEAADPALPLLDRVLYLAQVSAQLDEYFMVRVAALKQAIADLSPELTPPPETPAPQLRQIRAAMKPLLARRDAYFGCTLRPQLAAQGIHVLSYHQLTPVQQDRLRRRFEDEIAPVLTPLITPPNQPIPDFSNLSQNLAVRLRQGDVAWLAWVKLPRVLDRFLTVSRAPDANPWLAVPLEQVINAHLPLLFPDYTVEQATAFRVTRSANLDLVDAETTNLMDLVQDSLNQRHQQGQPVRLELAAATSPAVRSQLVQHLGLSDADVYTLSDWMGYADLMTLATLPRPDLRSPHWQPIYPQPLPSASPTTPFSFPSASATAEDWFTILQRQDVLLHFPYHSFAATVEQFVAQATQDPAVLAIKMTLYRTSGDTAIVRSLMAATQAGKQVVVLVELTTPLDEAINIHWARSLEKAGAHVVYGVIGLKTHTNLALVVRQEAAGIRAYAYVGTGDYLSQRPQPYADLGLLTGRPTLGQDLIRLFNFLTGYSQHPAYEQIWVAPVTLRSQLKACIEQEIQWVQAGHRGHLMAKLNVLADREIIDALYAASQAGVHIDLIVRGVCCLRPGVAGLSDRIRVVSVLGRYVEHSRILYCHNGSQEQVWIGSADWTPRGLDQRLEVLAPLQDGTLQQQVKQLLETWLADTQDTWELRADGRYVRARPAQGHPPFRAQAVLMAQAQQQGHPALKSPAANSPASPL